MNLQTLQKLRDRGDRLVMVTCYDYPSALLLEQAGVDILLVGDSLGDNVLGYPNTVPVSMDEMIHHARAVMRGAKKCWVVVDMPFMSYQVSPEQALENAGRILKETGAHAVKVEGGSSMASTVLRMVSAGIPVMGHIGLTPQSVHLLGYRVQGKDEAGAEKLLSDARQIEAAGAFGIVLEMLPHDLARKVTDSLRIPTIGIGAGPHCSGQVQVLHDLLGWYPGREFKHAKAYSNVGEQVLEAVKQYAEEVRSASFAPGEK